SPAAIPVAKSKLPHDNRGRGATDTGMNHKADRYTGIGMNYNGDRYTGMNYDDDRYIGISMKCNQSVDITRILRYDTIWRKTV
ncbi:unnamed protein product, partial [Didymodactylos carnosus]